MHKDNICEKSKFFATAVSSNGWREGREKLVRLPDTVPSVFQMYIHWVYTGEVAPEIAFSSTEVSSAQEQTAYFHGYLLADFLGDREMRNCIMETMISKCATWKGVPNAKFFCQVWERTPKGSPLRIFLVEYVFKHARILSFFKHVSTFPKEFLEQFAMLAMFQRSWRWQGSFEEKMRDALLPESETGAFEQKMHEMLLLQEKEREEEQDSS